MDAVEARPDALAPYDAILLVSFGGPEGPDEVLPFLRRVTAGRGIPDERLVEVGRHYALFGGRSPINDANRALVADLRARLDARGIDVPIAWGNRNSSPFLADAAAELADGGARRVLALLTSVWSSWSSCRQYRENLADAFPAELGIEVDKVRPYGPTPAFGEPAAQLVLAAVRDALTRCPAQDVHVLHVTHSIPLSMDETSGPGDGPGHLYTTQQRQVAAGIHERISAELGVEVEGELSFCSRSGPPSQPWLEPDVGDRIAQLAAAGTRCVIVHPIGFVSDHMEVVYDLDTEAAAVAQDAGVEMIRVPTVGTHPAFHEGLVDLLLERAAHARGEDAGPLVWPAGADVRPDVCAPGCCPNLRADRPALCGADR